MKKPRIANKLLESLEQAAQMQKGKLKGRETIKRMSKPAPVWTSKKIQELRLKIFKMSQPEFASLLNVKPGTIKSWEQNLKTPGGAAARLLEVLSKQTSIADDLAS